MTLVTIACWVVIVCEVGGFALAIRNNLRNEKMRQIWLANLNRQMSDNKALATQVVRIFSNGEWHDLEKVSEMASEEWRGLKKHMN